ncbi:hypothetical protein [Candidatus Agathobaculum pullicola]|uniref:hypothetical protein n=1 Tax=Candidatus Agathobaculum pullicola TaxID=2838426 RepID=UPI003F93004A
MAKLDTMAIVVTAINLCLWLAILAGLIALQAWLSRRKAWWPGLVMPVCTLPGVLLVLPNIWLNVLSQGVPAWQMLLVLLLCLLPTAVLLAIYFLCRRGQKRKKQLDKMNIQDL